MEEDTEFGRDLVASMQEAVTIVRGEDEPARVNLPPGTISLPRVEHRGVGQ